VVNLKKTLTVKKSYRILKESSNRPSQLCHLFIHKLIRAPLSQGIVAISKVFFM